MKKMTINKNILSIAYKLLHDAFLLILLSFMLILIAEGLIHGFVSSHLGLARIVMVMILNILAIVWIGNKLNITYPAPAIFKNKLLPLLVLFSFLLIGNSMLKFARWENFVITLTTLFVFFLLYRLIFDEEKK